MPHLRWLTAGESHGKTMVVLVDGRNSPEIVGRDIAAALGKTAVGATA